VTVLTPSLTRALARAVSQGVPLETAAVAAGIGERSAYDWLSVVERGSWSNGSPVSPDHFQRCLQFSQAIRRAQAKWEAKQVAGIVKAAEERNAKTGLQDWRARAWLLNNHPRTRERYRQHRELEVNGTQTLNVYHQQAKQIAETDGYEGLEALEHKLKQLPAPEAEELE
jgi:hypothetical protein